MSAQDESYSAPAVSEYNLDPGGNYVSPAASDSDQGSGVLHGSIIE